MAQEQLNRADVCTRLPVDGWQRHGGTHQHTAHEGATVTIHYHHHPFYGEHGKFIRRLRRYTSDQVVIELRDEVQVAIPSWMLDPVVCQQFRDEPQPRLAIAALLELRHLLDSQPLLTSRMVASRKRTSQQTGEDHARSQPSTSASTPPTIQPSQISGSSSLRPFANSVRSCACNCYKRFLRVRNCSRREYEREDQA